jgi:hypothetical protein
VTTADEFGRAFPPIHANRVKVLGGAYATARLPSTMNELQKYQKLCTYSLGNIVVCRRAKSKCKVWTSVSDG